MAIIEKGLELKIKEDHRKSPRAQLLRYISPSWWVFRLNKSPFYDRERQLKPIALLRCGEQTPIYGNKYIFMNVLLMEEREREKKHEKKTA